jgi:hypothetical protein
MSPPISNKAVASIWLPVPCNMPAFIRTALDFQTSAEQTNSVKSYQPLAPFIQSCIENSQESRRPGFPIWYPFSLKSGKTTEFPFGFCRIGPKIEII